MRKQQLKPVTLQELANLAEKVFNAMPAFAKQAEKCLPGITARVADDLTVYKDGVAIGRRVDPNEGYYECPECGMDWWKGIIEKPTRFEGKALCGECEEAKGGVI